MNDTGGLQPPAVCHNYCSVGQTQAPYPDCSCSGESGISPMPTGYGGGGYWTPVNSSGFSGANGSWSRGTHGAGWGVSAEDVLRAGVAAQTGGTTSEEGMIVVFIGSRNANETPYSSFNITAGAVSTYRVGAGGGWAILSTGYENFELTRLNGKHAMLTQGRTGTGTHTRLLVELGNVSVFYNESAHNVSTPKNFYVIVDAVPVTHAATSAVRLTLDLNRSISLDADGSTFIFTPVIEVDSLSGARYSIRDDGTADITAGTLALRELVLFNETGGTAYSVLGGDIAACMENCTGSCANIASAGCHAGCSPRCFGIIDTIPNSCDDGTAYGACSSNRPLYCVTGTYSLRCGTCGCPQDYACQSDGTCAYVSFHGGSTCGGEGCIRGLKPIACRHGQRVSDCVACGCPENEDCRPSDGKCVPSIPGPPTPPS